MLFRSVPYAYLIPQDPNKPEWCRVSEAGGVIINGSDVQSVPGVKAYVKVVSLRTGENMDDFTQALKEMAMANTLLARAIAELAKK